MGPNGMDLVPSGEAGVSTRQDFSGSEAMRQAETSIAMVAAQQKAMVEARFTVALRAGRNTETLRLRVLDLCKNPTFCAAAMYLKPVSKVPAGWKILPKRQQLQQELLKRQANAQRRADDDDNTEWPMGFSIRFIEAAIAEAGHIDCTSTVIWEDEGRRITKVDVIDLCRNNSFSRTVTTVKTVERRSVKRGQSYITTRSNSYGDTLYIIEATEAEVEQKEAVAVSKSIRTLGEKLFPGHLKLEWRERIEQTIMDEAARDPEAKKREILDSFHGIGIEPDHLEVWLEHSVANLQPAEYLQLKVIYTSMKSGDVTWTQVMEAKFGPADDGGEESSGAKKLRTLMEKKAAEAKAQDAKAATDKAAADKASADKAAAEAKAKAAPQTTSPQADTTARQQPAAPSASGPVRTYTPATLPDAFDVPLGTEALLQEGGKLKRIQVTEDPGEATKWKTIGEVPADQTQDPPTGRRGRNPNAFDEGGMR